LRVVPTGTGSLRSLAASVWKLFRRSLRPPRAPRLMTATRSRDDAGTAGMTPNHY